MFIVQVIGPWCEDLIPPIIPRLVSPDQQNRHASRIKRIQRPERPPVDLRPKLPHVGVPRRIHLATEGKG